MTCIFVWLLSSARCSSLEADIVEESDGKPCLPTGRRRSSVAMISGVNDLRNCAGVKVDKGRGRKWLPLLDLVSETSVRILGAIDVASKGR